MKTTVAIVALVLGPMIAVASPAHAATWQCADKATIQKVVDNTANHSGFIERYGLETPTGAPWSGSAFARHHFYELHGVTVTLDYGGATETLSDGATVYLTCTGVAQGDPLDVPNLALLTGTIVVHTTRSVPASVSTEEGLFGPVAPPPGGKPAATTYEVRRSLTKSSPSLLAKLRWLDDYANQPPGTTTTKTMAAPLKVNVTPYVGPQQGTCRQVDAATLTTTTSGNHGTAVYH